MADRKEWRRRVRAWKASGLSTAEFAATIGVRPSTLGWWRWRLGAEATRAAAPVTFVEVPQASPPAAHTGGVDRLEVCIGAARVLVPDGFAPETLGRVLDVLEGRT